MMVLGLTKTTVFKFALLGVLSVLGGNTALKLKHCTARSLRSLEGAEAAE